MNKWVPRYYLFDIRHELSMMLKVLIVVYGFAVTAISQQPCGDLTNQHRIVGGKNVTYSKYPWYVSFILRTKLSHSDRVHSHESKNAADDDRVYCGGSLITNQHVLTAAHCFKVPNVKPEELYWAILNMVNQCEPQPKESKIPLARVRIHGRYAKNDPYYDIAIVTLPHRVTNSPICLPRRRIPFVRQATIIGFGELKSFSERMPCYLQEVNIPIEEKDVCRRVINDNFMFEVDEKQFRTILCAGNLEGGQDACRGDSGGPLQTVATNDKYFIEGIVSFGFGCAEPDSLGIYTNVRLFLKWINNTIKK